MLLLFWGIFEPAEVGCSAKFEDFLDHCLDVQTRHGRGFRVGHENGDEFLERLGQVGLFAWHCAVEHEEVGLADETLGSLGVLLVFGHQFRSGVSNDVEEWFWIEVLTGVQQ